MRKKTIAELTLMSAEEYRRSKKRPVVVVCDSVRSLHNVGSLFRTVDALGMEGMVLCGITGRPPHPLLAKTALGAEQTVEWRYAVDAVEACKVLKEQGRQLVVLEQAEGSVALQEWHPESTRPIALVVGNEVSGVQQAIVDMADTVVEIPQRGTKHSLNVSVSAAMALWEWAREGDLEPGIGNREEEGDLEPGIGNREEEGDLEPGIGNREEEGDLEPGIGNREKRGTREESGRKRDDSGGMLPSLHWPEAIQLVNCGLQPVDRDGVEKAVPEVLHNSDALKPKA